VAERVRKEELVSLSINVWCTVAVQRCVIDVVASCPCELVGFSGCFAGAH